MIFPTRNCENTTDPATPVAVIGMACRFPGSVFSPETFWQLLVSGRDAVTDLPTDRWSLQAYGAEDRNVPGRTVAKHGGFIDSVDAFDPAVFGLSSAEAPHLDPQHRLMLMVVWEAMERARHLPSALAGESVGVFTGAFTHDYLHMQFADLKEITAYTSTGSMGTMLSNRVSHVFDFRGPSMTIDTACSSALLAVHLACESLRRRECRLAFAGGSQLMLIPGFSVSESQTGLLSQKGRCRSFSDLADGYVRAEGVGTVLLKLLPDALRNGDPIQAVIRGSAVNQDGRTQTIVQPRSEAQQAVIQAACANAGVDPGDMVFVEAHGTGTAIGDRIEADALGRVCRSGQGTRPPLLLGACKSVIGHAEAAAGIVGLIKAVICLQHGLLPGNLHSDPPNRDIRFDRLHLQICREATPLPEGPILAGVNAFGFGGTNVHVVLQRHVLGPEAVRLETQDAAAGRDSACAPTVPRGAWLLPLSARSPASLLGMGEALARRLENEEDGTWRPDDLCLTYALARHRFRGRAGVVFRSKSELLERLQTLHAPADASGSVRDLVWLFPGIGGGVFETVPELLATEPVFAERFRQCDSLWQALGGQALEQALTDPGDILTQPLLCSVQVSLAALWRSWGLIPAALVGHSTGEFAAFHLAGVYSLEQTFALLEQRCRLMAGLEPSGAMLALAATEEQIRGMLLRTAGQEAGLPAMDRTADLAKAWANMIEEKYPFSPCEPETADVVLAGMNGPELGVVTGTRKAVAAVAAIARREGRAAVPIQGQTAFHSPLLEPLRQALVEQAAAIQARLPQYPLYSTVTGDRMPETPLPGDYWARNMIDLFHLEKAMRSLADSGFRNFLEISPRSLLAGPAGDWVKADGGRIFACRSGQTTFDLLGELFEVGIEPNWRAMNPGAQFMDVPTYQWDCKTFRHESKVSQQRRLRPWRDPFLGERQAQGGEAWLAECNADGLPWLFEHRVMGKALLPAALYVESMLSAARETWPDREFVLEGLTLDHAAPVKARQIIRLHTVLDGTTGRVVLRLTTRIREQVWATAAEGILRAVPPGAAPPESLEAASAAGWREMDGDRLYAAFANMLYDYQGVFRTITQARVRRNEALCELRLPAAPDGALFHPAALDGVFQSLLTIKAFEVSQPIARSEFVIPVAIESLRLCAPGGTAALEGRILAKAVLLEEGKDFWKGDIDAYDDAGRLVCRVRGFTVKSANVGKKFGASLPAFIPAWRGYDPGQATVVPDRGLGPRGSWVVLHGDDPLGSSLAATLREKACRVAAFRGLPETREDVDALAAALPEDAEQAVVLWPLECEGPDFRACHALIRLVQDLALRPKPPQLWTVTRSAVHAAQGDRTENPFAALVWGLMRVVGQQEAASLWGGLVDVERGTHPKFLAETLLDPAGEDQVALRGEQRLVPRLAPLDLPGQVPPLRFQPDGMYVLTGALGGIGSQVAVWLAQKGVRHLLMLGRSENAGPRGRRIRAALRAHGAEAEYAAIDLADRDTTRAFLAAYGKKRRLPFLGLIHCAAHTEDQGYRQLDSTAFDRVAAAKAVSAWNLHHALLDSPLEYFVLFSSLGTMLALPGMASYSAANAVLDSLAFHRRAMGLPALSLAWGPWDAGIAAQNDRILDLFRSYGLPAITPEAAFPVMERLFTCTEPLAAPFQLDKERLRKGPLRGLPLVRELIPEAILLEEKVSRPQNHPNGEQAAQHPEQRNGGGQSRLGEPSTPHGQSGPDTLDGVILLLRTACAELIETDPAEVSPGLSLEENGIDSLNGVQLMIRIDELMQLSIKLDELLNEKTLAEVAAALHEKQQQEI